MKNTSTTAPDLEECYRILELYNVPENIIRHCREVMMVSQGILYSLGNAGCDLNEHALKAATMLHDIARSEKDHAQAGKDILNRIGYGKVGSIIGSHTDIEVDDKGEITEGEILYLADKLVKEDKVISIEERFNYSLDKYKHNPDILRKVENRRDVAYKIIKKIEVATKKDFIYGHVTGGIGSMYR